MDIQYKLIKNFGPSVFAAKIPEDIINKLNKYVDQLVEDQKKSRQQNYGENLVGDVTQEIKIDQNTIKESGWLKFLATCTKQWIELETKKKITKFRQDELDHKDIAYEEGATKKGFYAIMDRIIKTGSKLAINISEKI